MEGEFTLEEIAQRLRAGVEVRTRTYHLQSYADCFLGTEAVAWLITNNFALNVTEAEVVGSAMMNCGIFHHVLDSEPFCNREFYYRFLVDEKRGQESKREDGTPLSWADLTSHNFAPIGSKGIEELQPIMGMPSDKLLPAHDKTGLGISPLDSHNIGLLDLVHPPKWINPTPTETYNLVAIGGGAAGLVAASTASNVQAKVALIERHLLGGDCLNIGCVPSKALLKAAKVAHTARIASQYGISTGEVTVDFGNVMERMRRLRTKIAPIDSAQTKTKRGIDIYVGEARFLDPYNIEVTDDEGKKQILRFKKAVIATGASAVIPPIPGLEKVPYTTNATLFNLEKLPPRLTLIGAGPIGVEMAQAFTRFGSQVTILNMDSRILPREDEETSELMTKVLEREGAVIYNSVRFVHISHVDGEEWPTISVEVTNNGEQMKVDSEVLLVATGRRANVDGLGLEAAGVEYSTRGIQINDKLQTNKSHIYAAGDCCSAFQFTHVAGTMGAMAMRNAILFGNTKVSDLLIPWVTYTEPEIAHVGLYERDMVQKGIKYETFVKELSDVDRSILEEETEGWVKIHVKAGSDKILGATIVASSAGEMITEISLAMQHGIGTGGIAAVIHPYPTQAEAIRGAAIMHAFTRLTPRVKAALKGMLSITRR